MAPLPKAQGRGAAQHTSIRSRQQCLDAVGVVGAGVGGVQAVQVVLQHLNPVGALAADHRQAHAGAERGHADAQLTLQGLAQGGGGLFAQFVAAEDGDTLDHFVFIAVYWRCGNNGFVNFLA